MHYESNRGNKVANVKKVLKSLVDWKKRCSFVQRKRDHSLQSGGSVNHYKEAAYHSLTKIPEITKIG